MTLVDKTIMKSKEVILLPNVVHITQTQHRITNKSAFKHKVRGLRNVNPSPLIFFPVNMKVESSKAVAVETNKKTSETIADVKKSKIPKIKPSKIKKPLKFRNKDLVRSPGFRRYL